MDKHKSLNMRLNSVNDRMMFASVRNSRNINSMNSMISNLTEHHKITQIVVLNSRVCFKPDVKIRLSISWALFIHRQGIHIILEYINLAPFI